MGSRVSESGSLVFGEVAATQRVVWCGRRRSVAPATLKLIWTFFLPNYLFYTDLFTTGSCFQILRYLENSSGANAWRVGKLTVIYLLMVHWITCALIFILTSDGDIRKEEIVAMSDSEKFNLYVTKASDAFHVICPTSIL